MKVISQKSKYLFAHGSDWAIFQKKLDLSILNRQPVRHADTFWVMRVRVLFWGALHSWGLVSREHEIERKAVIGDS